MRTQMIGVSILVLAAAMSGAGTPALCDETPASGPCLQATLPAGGSAPSAVDAEHFAKACKLMDGGVAFLLSKRSDEGLWATGRRAGAAGISALALKALVQHPDYGPAHPVVAKGFEALLQYRQSDGGIYSPKEGGASYTSAVALMALVAARNPQYNGQIRELADYLKQLQIVPGAESSDGQPVAQDDPRVGGVSYGKGMGRPDLSNVGMWAEALHDAGVRGDDPAMQRAAAFISRLQNHTETNKMAWAQQGENDGGFVYTFPGPDPTGAQRGGARSYGSMTYTGFKSLLYAGVDRKDARVRAAMDWIRRYWRLDSNPNMPQRESRQGLYYYYHVFAKALRAWGEPVITDAKGVGHNWRHELIDTLAQQVKDDGSWVNDADRWWEGEPVLTTCYAILALQEALAGLPGPSSAPAQHPPETRPHIRLER